MRMRTAFMNNNIFNRNININTRMNNNRTNTNDNDNTFATTMDGPDTVDTDRII